MSTVRTGPPRPEDVPVRDAATVMLVRDGDRGLEVCLMQRNLASDFVGGAYVFPGGAVDPEDGDPAAAAVCAGLDDAEASRRLGVEAGGLAFWVAAIRESFEEAGVLIARHADGRPLDVTDPAVADRFVRHRHDVDTARRTIAEVAVEEELRLDAGALHYFSRWITPLGSHRRYDTRFFVAAAPDQEVVHDDRELIGTEWSTPAEALRRHDEGGIVMIFPTVRTLVALSRFDAAEDVLAHARALSEVRPVLPTMTEGPDGLRILLPGDPELTGGVYDAWSGRPLARPD
jgi:8-oxo-dGTP pyrophosphatase MutT (NUDIX family)